MGKMVRLPANDGEDASPPVTVCSKETYVGVERSRYITTQGKSAPSLPPTDTPEAMSTD